MTDVTEDEKARYLASHSEVSLLDIALVLRQNLLLLVMAPLLLAFIGFGTAWLRTPIFTATTTLMTPQKSDTASALLGSLGGLAGAAGALSGIKNPVDQWISLLKSRTVADAMVKRFNLRERYQAEYQFQARGQLAGVTEIQTGKDGLIVVSVDDKDPKLAADMANAYVEELQRLTKMLAVTEAGQRRLFFDQQLKEAKVNLDKASAALQQGGVGVNALKTDPSAALDMVAKTKAQIAAAEVRVSVMQGYLTGQSPELQRAQAELNSLRSQLSKVDTADASKSDGSETEYVSRYRDFKYYETLFELMAKQFELAKIDESRDGAVIQVVDPVEVPEWKSKPSKLMAAFVAAGLGLVASLLWIAYKQWKSSAARSNPDALQKLDMLTALPYRSRR